VKAEILALLANSENQCLSGEELSRRLGISRTAVWKHIKLLQKDGYDIQAVHRTGYRLAGVPDRLYPEEIKRGLLPTELTWNVVYYPEVSSTNEVAKKLADDGAAEGTVVIADAQTAGRGRLGRSWHSPPGVGIWLSLILRPPVAPPTAPQLTMTAAVAVCKVLRQATGVDVGIKWPNDLMVEGRKVCGILTEMKAEMDRVHYVVLGIGINVNSEGFPPEVAPVATSLKQVAGRTFNRVDLVKQILVEMDQVYPDYKRKGFTPFREDWQQLNVTLGQAVTVTTLGESFAGMATGIQPDGSLVVEGENGVRSFYAGDVTLRQPRT